MSAAAQVITDKDINNLAEELDRARLSGEPAKMPSWLSQMTCADGYRIHNAGLALRLERGLILKGLKLGLTSIEKMQELKKKFGLDLPLYGALTEDMELKDGSRFALSGRFQPKLEPEVAFLFPIGLKPGLSSAQVKLACSGVCTAIEIVDCRFGSSTPTIPEVIADSTIVCSYILGKVTNDINSIRLSELDVRVECDGKALATAVSGQAFSNIEHVFEQISRILAEYKVSIPRNCVVLSGSPIPAIPINAGSTYKVVTDRLGEVYFEAV